MKKFLAVLLVAVMALSICACGSDNNFPITVGQIKLSKAPENVVVLNADAADVMLNLGYSGAIAARSDECIQSTLGDRPSVGTAASPDIDAIIALNADAVLADETLSEVCLERLREAKINVFRLDMPQTEAQIKGFYRTIGLIMGGAVNGAKNAEQEYEALFDSISASAERMLNSNETYTICYLSLDSQGNFVMPEQDSFVYRLLSETGSEVLSGDGAVDELLVSRNPDYIFYNGQAVLDKLGSNPATAELSAVAMGRCHEFPLERLELVGISAALNIGEIMGIMYPQTYEPTPPEYTEPEDQPTDGAVFNENTVVDENSDPALISAMQQRLYDLGYSPSAPDGILGSATKQYIKDFQYINNFTVDGIADYEFLTALFSEDAIPRT